MPHAITGKQQVHYPLALILILTFQNLIQLFSDPWSIDSQNIMKIHP